MYHDGLNREERVRLEELLQAISEGRSDLPQGFGDIFEKVKAAKVDAALFQVRLGVSDAGLEREVFVLMTMRDRMILEQGATHSNPGRVH